MKHLYEIQENDTYVAETPEEAFTLWADETGMTIDDLDGGMSDVLLVPDDKVIKALVDEDGNISDDEYGAMCEKTAAEWAEGNPKGLLFSTEY